MHNDIDDLKSCSAGKAVWKQSEDKLQIKIDKYK